MNYTNPTAEYVAAVQLFLSTGTEIMTTTHCPECSMTLGQSTFVPSYHTIIDSPKGWVLVVGCEGYWLVDPNKVGVLDPNWEGIEGLNIPKSE